MKKSLMALGIIVLVVLLVVSSLWFANQSKTDSKTTSQDTEVTAENDTLTEIEEVPSNVPTERYSAQVDRVKVLFEQWDFTLFRLQTNELVREGEMNSERGFMDDPDATVYVLNWQKPEGEQIKYVRLTAEPGFLYALDGYNNIIRSGRLELEKTDLSR